MQQFIEFVINHWTIWVAFAVVLGLVIHMEIGGTSYGIAKATPQEAVNLINHQSAVVLDIRDKDSFNKGHILGAKHISIENFEEEMKKLNKFHNKPLIISCANGQLPPNIAAKTLKMGFTQLKLLKGGIEAWREASLPLTKE